MSKKLLSLLHLSHAKVVCVCVCACVLSSGAQCEIGA